MPFESPVLSFVEIYKNILDINYLLYLQYEKSTLPYCSYYSRPCKIFQKSLIFFRYLRKLIPAIICKAGDSRKYILTQYDLFSTRKSKYPQTFGPLR